MSQYCKLLDLKVTGLCRLLQAARQLFYIGLIIAVIGVLQYHWPLIEDKYGWTLPDMLLFPRFQIFFAMTTLTGVSQLTAILFLENTRTTVIIGSVLTVFLAFFVAWLMYIVWKYTIAESRLKFVVVDKAPPPGLPLAKHFLGNSYGDAYWEAASEKTLRKYGIAFESNKGTKFQASTKSELQMKLEGLRAQEEVAAGRIRRERRRKAWKRKLLHKRTITTVDEELLVSDPVECILLAAELERQWEVEYYGPSGAPQQVRAVERGPEKRPQGNSYVRILAIMRQMYFVIDAGSQIWMAVVIGSYPNDGNSYASQVYTILALKLVEIAFLWGLKPMIAIADFLLTFLGKLCDLGTAVCTVYLLNPDISNAENANLAFAMLMFQMISTFSVILWFWFCLMKDLVVPAIISYFTRRQQAAAETQSDVIMDGEA